MMSIDFENAEYTSLTVRVTETEMKKLEAFQKYFKRKGYSFSKSDIFTFFLNYLFEDKMDKFNEEELANLEINNGQ